MKFIKDISNKIDITPYIEIIAFVVEIVFVLLVTIYYVIPSYHRIKNLREENEHKKQELQKVTEYAEYLKSLASSTIDIEEQLINYALPSENDVITIIITYEGLAKTEGVEVSPIAFAPGVLEKKKTGKNKVEESTGLQKIPLQMEVVADDEVSARSLIEKIAKTRRIFDITSLSWEAKKENDIEQGIKMSIDIQTYYYIKPDRSGTKALVEQGRAQTEFISTLNDTLVFEDLVLEGVRVGKEDLFQKEEATVSAKNL